MSKRSPILLHILAAAFVLSFLINLAGIIQLVQSWNWLQAAGYYPNPIYVVFKDALLALASLAVAVSLWARLALAPRFSQLLAGLTLAWFWVDRVILTRNPLPFRNHLFSLVGSLLLIGFVVLSAWLLEPFMSGYVELTGEEEGADDERSDA